MNRLLSAPLLGICIAISMLLQGCSEPVVQEKKLRPVRTMTVEAGGTSRSRVFSGTAQAAQQADLSFKVSGSVVSVPVKVGDSLSQGALVARLDDETFLLELEQARADAAQANALRRSAEAEYQRMRQLYANDNASRNELDSALADAESAKASYDAATQSERLAALNLEYTRLTLDYDCSIAQLDVEPNENVSSGQTVATASCGEGWEVVIDVPESLIARFASGMPGSVSFPSIAGDNFAAQVTEVSIGTGGSATFPVTLALADAPANIRTNLAAEVTFQFASADKANTFYVPASAVQQDATNTFVYVMDEAEQAGAATLRRREVAVGEITELGLQVVSGLNSGERIITAGLNNAYDGMLVRDE